MSGAIKVRPHTELIRENDPIDDLFIIVEGWACRHTTTREGGRQISALLVPGDVCNLDTLMFDHAGYGVRTLTAATVMRLRRCRATALAAEHSGIARTFTWLAMVENTTLSEWVVSLGRRSAKNRLAHLLCELSIRLDGEHDGESRFACPLTQEHIGDVLGLTPVHVNRMIRRLREDGLIEIEERVVTLPDVARLRQVGGFQPGYLHAGAQAA